MGMDGNFRFLHIGLPRDIMLKKHFGDFEGAVEAIDRRIACGNTPEPLRKCLTAQREMIIRLPEEYPYTKDGALALLRTKIPDFTESEFDSLEAARRVGWIYSGGVKHYFGRFFDSLCKTDADIARRAGVRREDADGHDEKGELDAALRKMKERGSLSMRITCRASVRMKDEHFKSGGFVRAYMPLPRACASQSGIEIVECFPKPALITPEDSAQRVVFWEGRPKDNLTYSVKFSYTRTARYIDLGVEKASDEHSVFYTGEEAPHMLFTPYIRELTCAVTNGRKSPLEIARGIYDFITLNVKYSFMPSYFCLENIAENCALDMTGDCGVMTALFITMCRCAGVPARWESGWQAGPDFCGAHDWALFYAEPYGWLYADPSFGTGALRDGNEKRRRHYFGNLDPFRMAANGEFFAEFDAPKEFWRADPYDNQVGEMETDTHGLRYGEFERTKELLSIEEIEP